MGVKVATLSHRCLISEEMLSAPGDHMRLANGNNRSAVWAAVKFLGSMSRYLPYEPLRASAVFLVRAAIGQPGHITLWP